VIDNYKYLPFEIDGIQYAVQLEYVASILSSAENFPCCAPPQRHPCITRVLLVDQDLIAVVELNALEKGLPLNAESCQRPLILTFRHHDGMIGLLADRVSPPLEFSELKIGKDPVNQRTFLTSGTKNLILFDVPELFKALEAGWA